MEKVSVIIPVYNVEKYIRQCLDSIVNQTYTNIEIIIIDDGSPDNCGLICDEYKKRYRNIKVIHKENGGLTSARNVGIDIATGDWILFVDSDDWCDTTYIEKLVGADGNNENVDVIVSSSMRQMNNGDFIKHSIFHKEGIYSREDTIFLCQAKCVSPRYADKQNNEVFTECENGAPWDKLYKREIIVKNGLCFDTKTKVREDALFNIMYWEFVHAAKYVDAEGYYYRCVSNSITKGKDNKRLEKNIYFMDCVWNYVVESNHKKLTDAMRLRALDMCIVMGRQLFDGNYIDINNKKIFSSFLSHPMINDMTKNMRYSECRQKQDIAYLTICKCHSYLLLKFMYMMWQKVKKLS